MAALQWAQISLPGPHEHVQQDEPRAESELLRKAHGTPPQRAAWGQAQHAERDAAVQGDVRPVREGVLTHKKDAPYSGQGSPRGQRR